MLNKIARTLILWMLSFSGFAYQNTGYAGVDDPLTMGNKIGLALLFLAGISAIVGGFWKIASEQASGKRVGAGLICLGILAFGVLGLWTSKMSGFSF